MFSKTLKNKKKGCLDKKRLIKNIKNIKDLYLEMKRREFQARIGTVSNDEGITWLYPSIYRVQACTFNILVFY